MDVIKIMNRGGGNLSSDVFFVPATIQPKYFINDDGTEPIDIKNYTPAKDTIFLYNKEDIISLGVNEEDLNSLNIFGIDNAFIDADNNNHANGYTIQESVFDGKIILFAIRNDKSFSVNICNTESYVYKISDDVFLIIPSPEEAVVGPPVVNPGGPIY